MRGFGGGILQVVYLRFFVSKKEHCVAKVLHAIWETFLDEDICKFNP